MPSQVSLREMQYYGNPQNAFWWIMSELLGFSVSMDYQHRVDCVRQSSFAIWDVLSECERPGSLDSSIVRSSEIVNDLPCFLDNHKSISLLVFNGGAAHSIFKRHFKGLITSDLLNNAAVQTLQLPSTSPAYASMKKVEKLEHWRQALIPFL